MYARIGLHLYIYIAADLFMHFYEIVSLFEYFANTIHEIWIKHIQYKVLLRKNHSCNVTYLHEGK